MDEDEANNDDEVCDVLLIILGLLILNLGSTPSLLLSIDVTADVIGINGIDKLSESITDFFFGHFIVAIVLKIGRENCRTLPKAI